MNGNQAPHVIFHLPFIIDNVLKFDFRTAVIMFSRTSIHDRTFGVRFV